MNLDVQRYIREAKHSFAILLGFVGDTDTRCNRILLKWPDAMDALVAKDESTFKEDMAVLLCVPLRLVAESLQEIYNQRTHNDNVVLYDKQIGETIELASVNPIESKNNLIRLCNEIIFKLRSLGIAHEYVKTIDGDE